MKLCCVFRRQESPITRFQEWSMNPKGWPDCSVRRNGLLWHFLILIILTSLRNHIPLIALLAPMSQIWFLVFTPVFSCLMPLYSVFPWDKVYSYRRNKKKKNYLDFGISPLQNLHKCYGINEQKCQLYILFLKGQTIYRMCTIVWLFCVLFLDHNLLQTLPTLHVTLSC